MYLVQKWFEDSWKEAQSQPLRWFWSLLTLVTGISALIGVSELVLKVKGFALQLLNGYRLIWHSPIHWVGGLLGLSWPHWASDVIALFAVSSAAGFFVVKKVQNEAKLSRSRFRTIMDDFKSGRLKDTKLVETTILILRQYLLWLLAMLICAAVVLVASYVFVYVPVPSPGK